MDMEEILSNPLLKDEIVAAAARMIMNQIKPPEFSGRNIPVYIAAKIMGKNQQAVRIALQKGKSGIGWAYQDNAGNWQYYISPKKFYEETGYVYQPDQIKGESE